jgi:hypothetical protein
MEQPFVFASHVDQVFFSDSTHDLGWKVVLLKANKSRRMVGENVEVELKGVGIERVEVDVVQPNVGDGEGQPRTSIQPTLDDNNGKCLIYVQRTLCIRSMHVPTY